MQAFSNHEIDVEMMINKDKDFLNSLESVSGSKLEEDVLAKVIEESGSTFGDIVDSLIKTFASREFNLDI